MTNIVRHRPSAASPIAEVRPDHSSETDATSWAAASVDEVLARLHTKRTGLSSHDAVVRLGRYGPNTLPAAVRRAWYVELGANFVHLFALLLWAASALAVVAGMPQLAWAILMVILINGLFSYWQEYEAERATEALGALLPRHVTVRRDDGSAQMVAASAVVPGDILVLAEGEAVPADARVIASERLRLDLSSLTGESRPIPRLAHAVDVRGRTFVGLSNLVLAGAAVASGRGEAVVFATGAATEFGRIASLTQAQRE